MTYKSPYILKMELAVTIAKRKIAKMRQETGALVWADVYNMIRRVARNHSINYDDLKEKVLPRKKQQSNKVQGTLDFGIDENIQYIADSID